MDVKFQRIAELFDGYRDEMVRWARRRLGSEADAEDTVQEIMLFLLGAPHLLAGVERIGAWLYTLVRRRSVDLIRKESRMRNREAGAGVDDLFEGADPTRLLERREFVEAVEEAVEALDENARRAFVENGLRDVTFRDLEEKTGVPRGTWMARKKKAVDAIRGRLADKGFLPAPVSRRVEDDEVTS